MKIKACTFYILLFTALLGFFAYGYKQASAAVITKTPNNLGLVGYWSMNEGKGTKVGDSSGNKNTGTLTNMESSDWVAGKRGKALDFDGSNDYVDMGVLTALSGATKATLSGWLYRPNTSTAVGFGQHAEPYRFAMLWYTDGKVYSEAENGTASFPSFSNNQTGWHHYVMVYDGTLSGLSRLNVYWDGVLQSLTAGGVDPAATLPSGANQTDFRFGMDDNTPPVRDFDGKLDEVRVYNRALSASEVATLYQSGAVKVNASSADLDNGSTLEQGLVGHWTLDGQDTFWNSSTTLDRSGSGNTGTMTNMSTTTSPTPGKLGQALKFDGVNDSISTSPLISAGMNLSICAWINPAAKNNTNVIFGGVTSPVNHALIFRLNTGSLSFWDDELVGNSVSAAISYNVNTWYHVCVTRVNQTTTKFYLDSVDVSSTSGTADFVSTYTSNRIGLDFANSDYFNGSIDDVRVYNRVLSVTEIAQLYNLGQGKMNVSQNKTGNSLDNGLVGLWSFNGTDVSWPTIYDRSGQGNNGTATNMSTTTSPTPGKVGQALKFDGSDDYVNVSDHSSLDLSGSLSASFWINPKDYGYLVSTEKYGRILRKGVNYDILTGNDTPDCVAGISVSGTLTSTYCIPNAVTLNVWQHFVVVQTGGVFTLYKNGSLFGTATANIGSTNTNTLVIGNYDNIGSTPRYFNGSIDELRLYNRVLSADEVLRLYRIGR